MYLNPRAALRLLSAVAITVGIAFLFCPLSTCLAAQEKEAAVTEKVADDISEPGAIIIESVDDADAKTKIDKSATANALTASDKDGESKENPNKPWEEIVSPVAAEEADESVANSASNAAKAITLESLRWLYPLAFLLITLLVLGWLLALMTRYIRRNDPPSKNEVAGQTEAEFGRIFLSRPARCDDLTRIQGIDSALQGRLNTAGIYQVDQLKNMTPGQLAVLGRKVSLPRLNRESFSNLGNLASVGSSETAGVIGSVVGAGAVAASSALAASVSVSKGVSAKVGSVASSVPEPHFNKQANSRGVAAHAKGAASTKVNRSVGGSKGSTTTPPQTGSPIAKASSKSVSTTTDVTGVAPNSEAGQGGFTTQQESASKLSSGHATASNTQSETATQNLTRSFHTVYSSPPSDPDDLTSLAGIDAGAAKRLNAAGIYKFDQLKNLGGKQKTVLAAQLGFKDSDFKQWQRSISANKAASAATDLPTGGFRTSELQTVELSDVEKQDFKGNFGVLYTSPPADADDLTRLSGIDANTMARLNAAGIYKFDQLKNLDDNQEALLASQLQIDDSDFADWRRCMYAWGRGINTSAEIDDLHEIGEIHGIALPQIADGIYDGEKLIAYLEQVIFRGSNPEGWGRGGGDEIEGVATSLSCDAIRGDINYLRIRRADTRESVVLPMTKGQLFANGDPSENGWNGSSEVFFGGRHIGAFAQQLPQEVETKFSQGGWGFGHRYDHNDRQEWGWAGRVIEPTTFEISVGCAGEVPGTVVFRGSDPSVWNTRSREGKFGFANTIASVNHPVNFVRIMRHATGEAVIVRVDGNHVLDEGFDPRVGWNGSGAEFSGGMHLGVYHSDLPQDFETRFEFGGWGFGHPYDDNDRQAWGWAGRQLPETVFEISLLESVPEFMQHELVD